MTYKQALLSAKQLLTDQKITQPPVDVRKIIESLNITVSEAPHQDDGMSGLILRGSGKTLIGLNSTHGENRKRFTLAHELGHYQLHSDGVFVDEEKNFHVRYRTKNHGFDPKETEANAFAAELLMPEDWLKTDFTTLNENFKNLGIDGITDVLTKKYEVSYEAMKIRLETLALI